MFAILFAATSSKPAEKKGKAKVDLTALQKEVAAMVDAEQTLSKAKQAAGKGDEKKTALQNEVSAMFQTLKKEKDAGTGSKETREDLKKQMGAGWEEEKSTVSEVDRTAAREVVTKLIKGGNAGTPWWEGAALEGKPKSGGGKVDAEGLRARANQLLRCAILFIL